MPPYIEYGDTFRCPHCGQGWDVESWNTDHHGPVSGTDTVHCTKCDQPFKLHTHIKVDFTTEKA